MAALDKFMDQELEALRYIHVHTYIRIYVVGNQSLAEVPSSVLHHMVITWPSHGHHMALFHVCLAVYTQNVLLLLPRKRYHQKRLPILQAMDAKKRQYRN